MIRGLSVSRLPQGRARLHAIAIALLALAAVAASILAAPGLPGVLGGALALIAITIAAIDARWFIIPDQLSAAGFALALINAAVTSPFFVLEAIGTAILRAAVLGLLFYALRAFYRRLRGREGIGLGDVKLACVMGAWLDWLTLPIAVEIAALAALAAIGIRHYAGGRPLDATLKFPFGLFLAPSIWIGWLIEAMLFARF
jgi:leader peptidase (prepilin peptidase) / N-methyltransferase